MSWSRNRCGRHRESICLLLSGALSGPQRSRLEEHLAACSVCRKYCEEVQRVTMPLAGWEDCLRHIEPNEPLRLRWANAVRTGQRPSPLRRLTTLDFPLELWRELIWSARRIWAGFAVVWLALILINLSVADHPGAREPRARAQTVEPMLTWEQQEKLLAELMKPSEPPAAEKPKPTKPEPRSERQTRWRMA